MKPLLMVLAMGLLPMLGSAALEPGGYMPGTERAKELDKVLDSADREIECRGDDEFSIGVRRAGQELTFSLWELDTFLREEKHKDCLLLDTGKGGAPDAKEEKEERVRFIDKLVKSFSKYGYRRILIIGTTGGGAVELIADVTLDLPKPALEPGFCLAGSERATELEKVVESADREIDCGDNDKFSTKVHRTGQERNFSLSELDAFLRKETHKDCLVLWTGKRKEPDDEEEGKKERQRFADKWVQTFSKYGYRRIVLIGGMGSGYDLIADVTTEPDPAPAK